jgi:hypothetical protein
MSANLLARLNEEYPASRHSTACALDEPRPLAPSIAGSARPSRRSRGRCGRSAPGSAAAHHLCHRSRRWYVKIGLGSSGERWMRIDKTFLARLLGDDVKIANIRGRLFEAEGPDGLNSFKDLIHERLRKRIEALSIVLAKDDDLGKVVRAHIYVENELIDFMFFAAHCPDQQTKLLKKKLWDYDDKVSLALMLGLNSELSKPLNAAGGLRNAFAHNLDMKIGEEQAKDLSKTLSPQAKQKCDALWQSMLSDLDLKRLPPADRSCFRARTRVMAFFIHLFTMVAEERHRAAFEKLGDMAWH